MKNSYKKEAVSGVKWMSLSSTIVGIGSFVLILLLTNILDKKDFGLFALVNVVVGFSAEFVDIGISQAIVQKQNINKKQLSTLFWINILLACFVFFVINLSKDLIGLFYSESKLPSLLVLISFSFLLSGLSVQYQALLQKELKFKLMAVIDTVSFLAYFITTISMALIGKGVIALIWGSLARAGIKSILLIITGVKYHTPSFYFNLKEVKYFLNFGSFRTGSFLASFLNQQLDSILIGKFIGVSELGIYDVFKRIVMQPLRLLMPIIQKVVYPLMARVHENRERVTLMFIKILEMLNLIRFPIFLGIALCAKPLTEIFLGREWANHYLLLQALSFIYLFSTMQSFIGQSMIANGKANWGFYYNTIMIPINVLIIYVGSYWGIYTIVLLMLIRNTISIIPRYFFVVKKLYNITFSQYINMIFKRLFILITTLTPFYIATNYLDLKNIYDLICKAILLVVIVGTNYWFMEADKIKYILTIIRNDVHVKK